MSQREAMERDPWIGQLFTQSASELIAQHRLETVAEELVSKFSYACTGVSLDRITALDFLNVSQGLVVPIHRFRFDANAERDVWESTWSRTESLPSRSWTASTR